MDTDSLWKEFFRDPSQFWHNPGNKRSPTFVHKQTRELLWKNGLHNPPWVTIELTLKGILLTEEVPNLHFEDRAFLLNLIKTCGKEKNLCKARKIHEDMVRQDLIARDVYVGTALLTTYAKCGALREARDVFENLSVQDVVAWNALIAGYAQKGHGHEAIKCFHQMQDEGVSSNAITYICVLKACSIAESLTTGENIDARVRKLGLLEKDIVLGNTLVDMYAKCGALEKAREVFEQLPKRDVVSWNALIAGYIQHGFGDKAIKLFRKMQDEGFCPDAITYISVLKACSIIRSLELGQEIDTEIRKCGLLQQDILLATTLLGMYAKCGALQKAREVFDQLPSRDNVAWNALIAGYTEYGLGDEALKCFQLMRDAGAIPDGVTYVCILRACGIVRSLKIGEEIHAEVRKRGFLQKDSVLGNALVDMYAKCGALEKAQEVFKQLPFRDGVAWTSMIEGYAQQGNADEALTCFKQMQGERIVPNPVTFLCVLKACGIIGSLQIGEDIDVELRKQGLLQRDIVLGNSLLDMYAKCGALKKAQEVFDLLTVHDVVCWTGLMFGYAQLGQANVVLDLFRKMKADGIMPDLVTFLVLLTACSHAGLLEEGEKFFDDMWTIYRLNPMIEHYACMIDLFGRAGQFGKAKLLLNKVQPSYHLPLLLGILNACRKWTNMKLAQWAFEQSIQLDEKCSSAYISMANIYAAAGMETEAHEIEAWKVKNKASGSPGCSQWTDVTGNDMSSFDGVDNSTTYMYARLKDINDKQSQGYAISDE